MAQFLFFIVGQGSTPIAMWGFEQTSLTCRFLIQHTVDVHLTSSWLTSGQTWINIPGYYTCSVAILLNARNRRCRAKRIVTKSFPRHLNYEFDEFAQMCFERYETNAFAHQSLLTIHQVTTMLATSKNVIFLGHHHLLTTGTDDLTL